MLPKGGGERIGAGDGQGQQGAGVAGARLRRQGPEHPLVAGGLQVPAEEPPGQPQHRVEPVDGRRQEEQGLPQEVPPAQVEPLVGQDIAPLRLPQPLGQVDFRRKEAQHKGRAGQLALPHPRFRLLRPGHADPEMAVGQRPPPPQGGHPRQPQHRQGHQRRQGGLRLRDGLQGRDIHHRVLRLLGGDGGLARRAAGGVRRDGGRRLRLDLRPHRGRRLLQQGHRGPGAGEAHRAHHAEEHHRPQQQPEEGRGLQPDEDPPQGQHRQGGEGGGEAHAPHGQQQLTHGGPRSRR